VEQDVNIVGIRPHNVYIIKNISEFVADEAPAININKKYKNKPKAIVIFFFIV
jgi:hypothetical protein